MTIRAQVSAEAVRSVLRHPSLWVESLRAAWSMGTGSSPVPHGPYLEWRALTAYGDGSRSFDPDELVAYLRWRRRMRRGSV